MAALAVEPLPIPLPEETPPWVGAFARPRSRAASRVSVPPPPAGPVLPADTPVLDWLAHRLSPGEATVLTGNARTVDALLELVYAGCVRAGGTVSLVEGANRFHPYRLVERGRQSGVEPSTLLERIRLARAFTAYQLVALVEGWAREVRSIRPTLLVGHELPLLFAGEELPVEERVPLLRHVARTLRTLLRRHALPLLLTVEGGISGFPGLAEEGPRLFDFVRLSTRSDTLLLEAYREVARLRLVPRPLGQPGLESFAAGIFSEEVVGWDARPRRTVRRSRSG
jgi:hypothetical protein